MSIEDYRRDLLKRVAEAQDALDRRRPGGAEALGGVEGVGAAEGSAEAQRLRDAVADPAASVEARIAALGQLVSAAGSADWSIRSALAVLGDGAAPVALRLAALRLARLATFHSPSFAGWRAVFLDALRRAALSGDGALCRAAFEALAHMKDGAAQQMLLDGLTRPETARVKPEQALRLLSLDPHVGVQELARRLADAPPSEAVYLEALRVLASDPASRERFFATVLDPQKALAARMLAATALSNLAPALLRTAAATLATAVKALPPGAEKLLGDPGRLAKHIAALLPDAP